MMSRYTGRSLVVVALCLCFVVVHAVRDFHSSYCSFTPEELRGSSLVTWFQQPGGKICLRIDDGWNWWWERFTFISISLNVDLNFNSWCFFFLMRWIFFLFWWFCFQGRFLCECLCCVMMKMLIEEDERQFCRVLWISWFF